MSVSFISRQEGTRCNSKKKIVNQTDQELANVDIRKLTIPELKVRLNVRLMSTTHKKIGSCTTFVSIFDPTKSDKKLIQRSNYFFVRENSGK